ncbi:MAG: hypothetical protein MMC33_001777 [Icmadophila ericetorum]|nr:hypothetical protein [Icmadophila ericetorum]
MATPNYPDPLYLEAPNASATAPSLLLFLHGLGDDGTSYEAFAKYLQEFPTLAGLHIVLPTAPRDHESMMNAWFTPKPFSMIPVGKSSSGEQAKNDDDEEQDTEGWMRSVKYAEDLVLKECKERSIPLDRAIVAGFSQGAAVSLGVGLGVTGEKDRPLGIAGVGALCGFLPLQYQVPHNGSAQMKFWLAAGSRDMLVPGWLSRNAQERLEKYAGKEAVERKLYEGLGHGISRQLAEDFAVWLGERMAPGEGFLEVVPSTGE